MTSVKSGLEAELQSKLDLARIKRLRNLAKSRSAREIAVGWQEVCVVQEVEEFSSELQVHVFNWHAEALICCNIQLIEIGTSSNIPSCISKWSADRSLE